MPLTETAIKRTKAAEKQRKFSDAQGPYFEASPAGGKWWRLTFGCAVNELRLSLGIYPRVSLVQARKHRDSARAIVATGFRSCATRKKARRKAARAADDTFEAVAPAWCLSWKATRAEKHATQVLQRLESDIFPKIGRIYFGKVTAPMLVTTAKKMEGRGPHNLAQRTFQLCNHVLRCAEGHELAAENVAIQIKPSDVFRHLRGKHFARLNSRDAPELLYEIDPHDGHIQNHLAIKRERQHDPSGDSSYGLSRLDDRLWISVVALIMLPKLWQWHDFLQLCPIHRAE